MHKTLHSGSASGKQRKELWGLPEGATHTDGWGQRLSSCCVCFPLLPYLCGGQPGVLVPPGNSPGSPHLPGAAQAPPTSSPGSPPLESARPGPAAPLAGLVHGEEAGFLGEHLYAAHGHPPDGDGGLLWGQGARTSAAVPQPRGQPGARGQERLHHQAHPLCQFRGPEELFGASGRASSPVPTLHLVATAMPHTPGPRHLPCGGPRFSGEDPAPACPRAVAVCLQWGQQGQHGVPEARGRPAGQRHVHLHPVCGPRGAGAASSK